MPRNEKGEFQILASAARTATTTVDFALPQGRGMILFVDITARAGACTLTPQVIMRMPGVTDTVSLWTATAALNSADTTVAYALHPDAESDAAADYTEEVGILLPVSLKLTMTHSTANSITYSVWGVELP